MQTLISQIQHLSNHYVSENKKLLLLLQSLMKPKNLTFHVGSPHHEQSMDQDELQEEMVDSKFKKSTKESFLVKESRCSKSTIRKCQSCSSIKNSRVTEKSLQKKKQIVSKVKHQSNMMKLHKLSQKMLPKVSKSYLYNKKSKILHFQS